MGARPAKQANEADYYPAMPLLQVIQSPVALSSTGSQWSTRDRASKATTKAREG